MTKVFTRLCSKNNSYCEHSYIAYGEPSLIALTMQLKAGKITNEEFEKRASGRFICCRLTQCNQ